jgi:broad specificity phosphatase PhoE
VNNRTGDPASIERDLTETRARLGRHLDELTSRLSPGQLIDEGLSYLRNGQANQFMHNLTADLRDNPLPVALAGLGLAWLAVSTGMQRNGNGQRALVPYDAPEAIASRRAEMAERARRAGEAVTRTADETEEAFNSRVAEARARVIGIKREAAETAAAFADRVQQGVEAIQRNAHEAAEDLRETAAEWRDKLMAKGHEGREATAHAAQRGREFAARAGSGIAETFSDNPLLLAALGVSAGALLGALLPPTEQEERLVGSAVGNAVQSARDIATDMVERGSRAAEAAVSAGYKAAQDQMSSQPSDT